MKLKGENWQMAKRKRLYYRRWYQRYHEGKEKPKGLIGLFEPVQAYPLQVVRWEHLSLYARFEQKVIETKNSRGWCVYEVTTGERLLAARTMDQTIWELIRRFEHCGREKVDAKIAEVLAEGAEYHSPLCSPDLSIEAACGAIRTAAEVYLSDVAKQLKAEAPAEQDPAKIPYPAHPVESMLLLNATIDRQPVKVGNPAVLTMYIEIKQRR